MLVITYGHCDSINAKILSMLEDERHAGEEDDDPGG